MNTTKPNLRDYGVTTEQYERYIALKGHYGSERDSVRSCITAEIVLTIILIGVVIYLSLYVNLGFAILVAVPPLYLIVDIVGIIKLQLRRGSLGGSKIISQIKRYEEEIELYRMMLEEDARMQKEAEKLRQRKLHDFWMSLSGTEFERELATLYRQLGYDVQFTPTSGDEGVDLILRKDGKKTVVQCKSHKYPVGPATARELYGSLMHFEADSAILACTGGFTSGVHAFVREKAIELISASELVMLTNELGDGGIREEDGDIREIPQCPRCRREMRLLSGRHEQFWSCTGYPQCIGTRAHGKCDR